MSPATTAAVGAATTQPALRSHFPAALHAFPDLDASDALELLDRAHHRPVARQRLR